VTISKAFLSNERIDNRMNEFKDNLINELLNKNTDN
jgi:hypothetical protein